ncbi:MAG: hypothetical protein U1E77_14025 [Inhella sp.]
MHTLPRLRPCTQTLVVRWLLGVWLFALLQGLANACLTQPQLEAQGRVAAALERAEHEAHGHAGGHDGAAAHAALCLKTCDDTQSGAWNQSPPWLPDLDPALPTPIRPWAPAPAPLAQAQIHGLAPPGDPPPAIRFLKQNR